MSKRINIDRELGKLIRFLEWKKQLEYDTLVCYPDEIRIENALIVLRYLKNKISNTKYIEKSVNNGRN